MWSTQRLESFQPLARLPNLEALFLTNCRPASDGIEPLHEMPRLRYLEIAAFYSDEEFRELRQALPNLECQWFQQLDRYGSIKVAIKEQTKGLTNKD